MSPPRRACALYTRKSSDEGLNQAFNSLDAQREACAAYVKSQAGEGWRALPERYDDGGVSGGTMERPALRRLLADIARGRVGVVVVYKIDRLTRSLADFARMVEIFDRHSVSFVSVTQAFNTTSSMGRLTLNVLLSFAQFEREVTGERIRDKIAASKARGLWMGGAVPFGYDPHPDPSRRELAVNETEAEVVRGIFRTYLELGSVHALERHLAAAGVRSRRRTRRDGTVTGDQPFSRGALFYLLRNPTCLGLIRHGSVLYPGLHPPIVERCLFDAVQARLDAGARRRATPGSPGSPGSPAALTGRIFDATGSRMSPATAIGARGRTYRYYVSAPLQQGRRPSRDGVLRRVPAGRVEDAVTDRMRRLAGVDAAAPLASVLRVEVRTDCLAIILPASLRRAITASLAGEEHVEEEAHEPARLRLILPFAIAPRGGPCGITRSGTPGPRPDPVLIRALRTAHAMLGKDDRGRPLLEAAPITPHRRRLVRLAFLAPALQAAILAGRQPRGLTLARLLEADIPPDWDDQVRMFGQPLT